MVDISSDEQSRDDNVTIENNAGDESDSSTSLIILSPNIIFEMVIIKDGRELPNLMPDVIDRLDLLSYDDFLETLDDLLIETIKITCEQLKNAVKKEYQWVWFTLQQSQQKSKPIFNALSNQHSFFILQATISPHLKKQNGT